MTTLMSNVSTQLTKVMDMSVYLCRLLDTSHPSSTSNLQPSSQTDSLGQNFQHSNKQQLICDECQSASNCKCAEGCNKRIKTDHCGSDIQKNPTAQSCTNSHTNIAGKLNENSYDKQQVLSQKSGQYEPQKSNIQSSRERLTVAIESSAVTPNITSSSPCNGKKDINTTPAVHKKSPNFISSKIDVSDLNILRKQNVSMDKPAKVVRPNVSKSSISTQTTQNRPIILNQPSKLNNVNAGFNNTSLDNSSVCNTNQQNVIQTVSSDNSNTGQYLTLHTINLPFHPISLPQIGQQPVTQIAQQQISLPQLGQNFSIPQVGQQQMFFQLQPSQTGLQLTSVPQTKNSTQNPLLVCNTTSNDVYNQDVSVPMMTNNPNHIFQPTSSDSFCVISTQDPTSTGANQQPIVSDGIHTTISECEKNQIKTTIIHTHNNNGNGIVNVDATISNNDMGMKRPTSLNTMGQMKKISDVCLSQSAYSEEHSDSIKDLITIDDDLSEGNGTTNNKRDNLFTSDDCTFSPADSEGHGNIFEKIRPSLVRRHMRLHDTAFDVRKQLTFDSEFCDLYPDSEHASETKACQTSSQASNMLNSGKEIKTHDPTTSHFLCTACKYSSSSGNYVFNSESELQQHTLTSH